MLLRSLKLKNIRSYTEQSIEFPESITLLAGDIGSGKSTLLLAIEFALFGISKPDLTGETLLRKGTTQAAVELNFQLENQNITIQRNLKKTKTGINQSSGHLIINNLKKELTPVELKTEIISLLHYPEELITKTKNYIFRYTLYTPQEEMRLILQDAPDRRLDTLRKIFSLDKYKKIRENLWFYLKEIRIKSTVLKTKIEPLEQKKEQLKEQKQQKQALKEALAQLLPKLREIKQKIEGSKKELQALEQQNQQHLDLKNRLVNLENLLKEKQGQKEALSQKRTRLKEKISQLIIPQTKEEINQELKELQGKHQEFLSQSSALSAKISHCQEKVRNLQKEISPLSEQTAGLEKKEEEIRTTKRELADREKIRQEKERIESSLDQIKQNIHQNQLLLNQAKEIIEKISRLEECPTCLQKVPPDYKKQVFQRQQEKTKQAEKQLRELAGKKSELQKQFLEINQQFDSLLKKENWLTKLQAELANLKEKLAFLKEKREQLPGLIQENNSLIKKLEKLKPEELENLNWQISQKQELLQKLIQKEELENSLKETEQNLKETAKQAEALFQEKQLFEQRLGETPCLTREIEQQKKFLEEFSEKEKILFSEKTKLDTRQENLEQQIGLVIKEIDQLNEYRNYLTRLTEFHYWLDEFLIKLTYTIEKQILIKIHHLFSHLFQEWFSILVEDENFSARLDDEFTPIIEQNGYEIYFNNLSGGERTAASLSYRLALNKVINDIIHEIKTKDLLILDEPTDGFSSEQLDKIRDVLEKLNLKQVILVSHESKIESFVDNVIRITKSEGVSRVV